MIISEELFYEIRIQSIITEREGMIAENQQRLLLGQSVTYREDAFLSLVAKFDELIEELGEDE